MWTFWAPLLSVHDHTTVRSVLLYCCVTIPIYVVMVKCLQTTSSDSLSDPSDERNAVSLTRFPWDSDFFINFEMELEDTHCGFVNLIYCIIWDIFSPWLSWSWSRCSREQYSLPQRLHIFAVWLVHSGFVSGSSHYYDKVSYGMLGISMARPGLFVRTF